jgi:hypothetical protein
MVAANRYCTPYHPALIVAMETLYTSRPTYAKRDRVRVFSQTV